MQQPDVTVEVRIPTGVPVRPLSDEVRASLEAIRVAQVAAQMRSRRQTLRARLWLATVMAGTALAAVALAPRLTRRWHARAQHAAPASASPRAPEPAAAVTAPPAAVEPAMAAGASAPALPSAAEPPAASPQELSPIQAQAQAGDLVGAAEGCDFGSTRPWRLSAPACARAFAADPTNAGLALALAQAEHAHGSVTAAAEWAQRALALNPNAAEAYILIARAELKSGRSAEGRAAYRRYLELAPRGWHHAEARSATRD
jgi:tetratricopeptide (TPR) repeat protein